MAVPPHTSITIYASHKAHQNCISALCVRYIWWWLAVWCLPAATRNIYLKYSRHCLCHISVGLCSRNSGAVACWGELFIVIHCAASEAFETGNCTPYTLCCPDEFPSFARPKFNVRLWSGVFGVLGLMAKQRHLTAAISPQLWSGLRPGRECD